MVLQCRRPVDVLVRRGFVPDHAELDFCVSPALDHDGTAGLPAQRRRPLWTPWWIFVGGSRSAREVCGRAPCAASVWSVVCFGKAVRQAGKYLRGLLSDLPRQNCLRLAEHLAQRATSRVPAGPGRQKVPSPMWGEVESPVVGAESIA
jgi:hypothetical protein